MKSNFERLSFSTALVEPQTMEPIDTMNILNMPLPTIKTTQEVEAAKMEEPIDNSELKLMLFPSQIQKLTSLLALMAHLRDFMERMIEAENNDAFSTFQWNAQLRYYYNKDTKGVTVKVRERVWGHSVRRLGRVDKKGGGNLFFLRFMIADVLDWYWIFLFFVYCISSNHICEEYKLRELLLGQLISKGQRSFYCKSKVINEGQLSTASGM